MILGKDALQVSDNELHCGLDQIMFISKVKDEVREIVNVLHLFKTFFPL